jgi:hypothetical protein
MVRAVPQEPTGLVYEVVATANDGRRKHMCTLTYELQMSAHVKRPRAVSIADVRPRHGLGVGHVGCRRWGQKADAK